MHTVSEKSNLSQIYSIDDFNETYEQAYLCTYLECIIHKDTRGVIFSRQGHDFYQGVQWFMLLGVAVLIGLFITLSKELHHGVRNTGILFSILGLGAFVPLINITWKSEYFDMGKAIQLGSAPLQIPLLILLFVGIGLTITTIIIRKRMPIPLNNDTKRKRN